MAGRETLYCIISPSFGPCTVSFGLSAGGRITVILICGVSGVPSALTCLCATAASVGWMYGAAALRAVEAHGW
jgi:hypothetical protein